MTATAPQKLGRTQTAILATLATSPETWTDLLTALELADRHEVTRRTQIAVASLVRAGLVEMERSGTSRKYRPTVRGLEAVRAAVGTARVSGKVEDAASVEAARRAFFAKLPEVLECKNGGHKVRKEEVGLRVAYIYAKRIEKTVPKVYRQSYCHKCRCAKD